MAKPELAQLRDNIPMATYDELTVMLSALATQVAADRELLQVARSDEIAGLAQERINIGRSWITACLEARVNASRTHGGPLEPLRVLWEQTETTTAPWR